MASISPPATEGPRRIPLSLSQGSPRWTSGLLASSPMGLCSPQGPYVVPGAPPTAPPCGNFEDCRLRAQGRRCPSRSTGIRTSEVWSPLPAGSLRREPCEALSPDPNQPTSAGLSCVITQRASARVSLASPPPPPGRTHSPSGREIQARKAKSTSKVTHRGRGGRVGGRLGAQV